MKIILMSGPPSSGKDTAAKNFYKKYNRGIWPFAPIVFERFSQPLKASFAAITKTSMNEFFEVEYYEEHKSEIIPWLGVSYRQYQIDFSEKFMKPTYGQRVFGNLFLERLKSYSKESILVIPDSGFRIEIDVLEDYLFPLTDAPEPLISLDDILLCRMHRNGFNFTGDSREYVYSDKIFSVDLKNNSDAEFFARKSEEVIKQFLKPGHGDLKRDSWI